MQITRTEFRKFVRACLTLNEGTPATALHQRFPFLGEDAVKLLSQFIWRFAADIARQKMRNQRATSPDATAVGSTAQVDQSAVQDIAQDTILSVGESLKDLVQHFVPNAGPQKKVPAAPPSRATGSTSRVSSKLPPPPSSKRPVSQN